MYELGGVSNQSDIRHLITPILISGFAITTIFVPMTTYSMATIPPQFTGDATGLTSLLRNLGGSVGISLLTTLIARSSQTHQALLVRHFSPNKPAFAARLEQLSGELGGSANPDAVHRANAVLYHLLQTQSALWAYVEQFRLLVLVCLACAPLVFLFRRTTAAANASIAH
jgi:MFS transporter, DHA2 family, multidrug resistance protein